MASPDNLYPPSSSFSIPSTCYYEPLSFLSISDVPDSCCKADQFIEGCGKGASPDKIYVTGCLTSFETFITSNAVASIGVGVGVIVLLFLGVCVSCCVAKGMAEKHSYA